MRSPWSSLAVIVVLAPGPAAADRGPPFAAGLDYTVGHGGEVGELDLGLRLEPGLFVRVGRWNATLSMPTNPTIRSTNVERDTAELTGIGVSARLAYRAPLFGGVLTIGGAITRRWVWSNETVTRTCTQTGECIAGTYFESPSYHAWAPQLRVGIGPDKQFPSLVVGLTFEVIVEAIGFNDVPPGGIRDVVVMGAATFTIGGGPRRRSPPPAPPALIGQNL